MCVKRVDKKLRLDKNLCDAVDDLYRDVLTGKVQYGAWPAYIERLIRKDLRERGRIVEDVLRGL